MQFPTPLWRIHGGVEHVMGFCTPEEYELFLADCPWFERSLVGSGIVLVKYWLSVSDEEQERRFRGRLDDPQKRWKLSNMDLEARVRWVDYSEAKDHMFRCTDIDESPWWVVEADDKKAARLNLISHLLTRVPYERLEFPEVELPERQQRAYRRPPKDTERLVPARYEMA